MAGIGYLLLSHTGSFAQLAPPTRLSNHLWTSRAPCNYETYMGYTELKKYAARISYNPHITPELWRDGQPKFLVEHDYAASQYALKLNPLTL
jgi:hypothetical protein